MAPRCCPCNGSGRCKSCGCVRRGSSCVDCYIGEVRCQNRKLPGTSRSSSQPLPGPLPIRIQPLSSSQPGTDGSADLPERSPKAISEPVSSRPLIEQTAGQFSASNSLSEAAGSLIRPRLTEATSELSQGSTVRRFINPGSSSALNQKGNGNPSGENFLARSSSSSPSAGPLPGTTTKFPNHIRDLRTTEKTQHGSNAAGRAAPAGAEDLRMEGCGEPSSGGMPDSTQVKPQPREADPRARVDSSRRELPEFQPASAPSFNWGSLEGEDFAHALTAAYAEVVHWRRNIFSVPSGSAGKAFVLELSRLIRAFCERSALETVAMKAIMVLPHLALQKPHPTSTSKEHQACLERRLVAWEQGDIDGLIREGRTIQHHLRTSSPKTTADTARSFAKLMMEGKVNAALRLLSNDDNAGVLSLDETISHDGPSVREILKEKHPDAQALPDRFTNTFPDTEEPVDIHPVFTIRNRCCWMAPSLCILPFCFTRPVQCYCQARTPIMYAIPRPHKHTSVCRLSLNTFE